MFEVGDLLSPSATLAAISLAVFIFSFPRSLSIYKEKRTALLEADVPDPVKEQRLFKLFVFGDGLLLFFTGLMSLTMSILFIIFMSRTISLYLGSPFLTASRVLGDFGQLLLLSLIVLIVLVLASLALFTTEVIVGEKRLPLLARVYARSVLGRGSSKVEIDSLVPEARSLYEKGAFGESVLYSMASLELALRNNLDLPEGVGFGRLLGTVRERLEGVISVEELIEIRRLRNSAAHPSPERRVTKQDAEQVLHLVENILQKLQASYQVILREVARDQLDKIAGRNHEIVNKAILLLGQEPRPKGSKRLAEGNLWLVRAGQYRISYSIDDEQRQIIVVQVTKHTKPT